MARPESGRGVARDPSAKNVAGRRAEGSLAAIDRGGLPRPIDRVYALGANGELLALEAASGRTIWRRNLHAELGCKLPAFGFTASPLIEGNTVLVEAGCTDGRALMAFDKKTGEVVWGSGRDPVGYSSPIAVSAHGLRQLIFLTSGAVVSLSPSGQPYWRHEWKTEYGQHPATPVFIAPDRVFVSSGYGNGGAVLQIAAADTGLSISEVWFSKEMKNHISTSVYFEGAIYGFDEAIFKCMDAATGAERWKTRGYGKGTLILADGHLIVLGDAGKLAIVEATPDAHVEVANAQVLGDRCWTAPQHYISDKAAVDMMLAEESLESFMGGAGSCAGCGEATVIRMWLAALAYKYGSKNLGIVASTGCNTVYGSTYPYNPYTVPWTNSLFENGPADAIGVRLRWDQMGWQDKQLWMMGGDGAMNDIGLQSLSRMLSSGLNIKVIILDTQVYSNTGGQASTSTFPGQETKMSQHGKAIGGKHELRKEIGRICMMHPNTFVAQTVASIPNHFYKSILDAASFDGPAVVNMFTTCQPEHGVGDDAARKQAKLAVESRAFPVFVYDPRSGDTLRERLSLQGNPGQKEDWYAIRKTGKVIDFINFARSEGRFAKHFDREGNPSETLMAAQADRLGNWHLLQEMAGLR